MKTIVVANPTSSGGRVGREWKHIERTLVAAMGQVTVRFTAAPHHATQLVRDELVRGADLIVAVGGDGTFSEVTDGFFQDETALRPEAALGLIPMGTGGDFRRTVDVPRVLGEAVARLRNAEPRVIDVGRLRYVDHKACQALRHFLNIASFGVGGLVDEIVNRASTKRVLGGQLSFALATLRAMLRYRHQRVRLRLDEGEPREARILNVAVANGRFFGGGMKIAPRAELNDGLFDVVELGDLKLLDFLLHGQKLRNGDHLAMKEVSFARAKRVEAHPAIGERVLLDVDGEQPGMLPATFEIVPCALRLKA